jgi:hypothetical protein
MLISLYYGWGPDIRFRENFHGASHLTAIRNAPPGDGCSRNTSPLPSSRTPFGKRMVIFTFERRASLSHRRRRPWVLTFSDAVTTSLPFPPSTFRKAGCRTRYLPSLRRSFWNMIGFRKIASWAGRFGRLIHEREEANGASDKREAALTSHWINGLSKGHPSYIVPPVLGSWFCSSAKIMPCISHTWWSPWGRRSRQARIVVGHAPETALGSRSQL